MNFKIGNLVKIKNNKNNDRIAQILHIKDYSSYGMEELIWIKYLNGRKTLSRWANDLELVSPIKYMKQNKGTTNE